jgi:transposase
MRIKTSNVIALSLRRAARSPARKLALPAELKPKDTTVLTWTQMQAVLAALGVRDRLLMRLDMSDALRPGVRQQARRELLAESRKNATTAKLRQIPSLGPIRAALAVALIQTPHRFRTKRQLWAYSGLALETRTSGEHCYVRGQLRRSKKQVSIRGLNKDHNHDLKGLFKGAATRASVQPGPFQDFYQRSLAKGIKPTMVRLTLARKIAAITLTLWKKGENFDVEKLKSQAA